MCHQQGQNRAHQGSHSQTGEPRTHIISRVQIQLTMEATHFLESQGHAPSAGSKSSLPWKPLTSWGTKDRSRGQESSAGSKSSSPQKPLTDWRAKNTCCQQGQNPAYHRSCSLPEGPRTHVVSMVKIHVTTEATHFLESQGQVSSAGS